MMIAMGAVFAMTGGYFYGRPYPYSAGSFDPGSHDGLDAIGALFGAGVIWAGTCLLTSTAVSYLTAQRRWKAKRER